MTSLRAERRLEWGRRVERLLGTFDHSEEGCPGKAIQREPLSEDIPRVFRLIGAPIGAMGMSS